MEYPSDFTIDHYKDVLVEAKRKYIIRTIAEQDETSSPGLLLRHDIDISPRAAHTIAVLENEMNISSSYYVLLHSPFYNPFTYENLELIKNIVALGHEVGLHFDSHFFCTKNESELEEQLMVEKKILESYLRTEIKSFSFHLTNTFTKTCNKTHYCGLKNAFPAFFQNDSVYSSDSYGVWRFKRLYDYIAQTKEPLIQVLTHPEWWVFGAMESRNRIDEHIKVLQQSLWAEAEKNYILK
jgi:hypothetical protein